jgi:hypothetical protein
MSGILFPNMISAQEIRKNENGETIIVSPDGTWRYFNKEAGGGNYPVYTGNVSPMDNPVLLTEEDARKIANRRALLAKEANSLAHSRAEKAAEQRTKLEGDLEKTTATEGEKGDVVQQLNLRLGAAKRTELEAQKEAQMADQELIEAETLTHKGNILQEFKKAQTSRASAINLPKSVGFSADFLTAMTPQAPYYSDLFNTTSIPRTIPVKNCRYTFEGVDAKTNRVRRDLEPQPLFNFTDEKLRMFLKDKEYLRCQGYLSAVDGGFRVLTLEFTFASPNAREAYGFIEKGSMLAIKLLDGNFVNLTSGAMDRGSYDTKNGLLTYRVQYPIDHALLPFLQRSEVDKVRVFWSSGFEEYEVYNLDFFTRQVACLDH